jgi:16S rRNA processing protein RimM
MAYKKHILLGQISKIHSYDGTVSVKVERIFSENMPELESVFLEIEGKPVPFFISSCLQAGPEILRLKFEGYESGAKVKEFRDAKVFLTTESFYENISDSLHSLIDYKVFSQDNEFAGKVKEVIQNPGQWLMNIINDSGKEILLPLHEDFVKDIKHSKKVIIMVFPEGIKDIN